jgi:hypothetical protein
LSRHVTVPESVNNRMPVSVLSVDGEFSSSAASVSVCSAVP